MTMTASTQATSLGEGEVRPQTASLVATPDIVEVDRKSHKVGELNDINDEVYPERGCGQATMCLRQMDWRIKEEMKKNTPQGYNIQRCLEQLNASGKIMLQLESGKTPEGGAGRIQEIEEKTPEWGIKSSFLVQHGNHGNIP